MRASDEATVPNRSAPAFQSAASRAISSRVRPTEVHDMTMSPPKGGPPTVRAAASPRGFEPGGPHPPGAAQGNPGFQGGGAERNVATPAGAGRRQLGAEQG